MLISASHFSSPVLAILVGYAALNFTDAGSYLPVRYCGTKEKANASLDIAQHEKVRNIAPAPRDSAAIVASTRGRDTLEKQTWKEPTSFARCARR